MLSFDVSEIVNYGYFPSYNIAYSPIIRDVSGVTGMVRRCHAWYLTSSRELFSSF